MVKSEIISKLFLPSFLTVIGCIIPCSLIDFDSSVSESFSKSILGWKGFGVMSLIFILEIEFTENLLSLSERVVISVSEFSSKALKPLPSALFLDAI